METAPDRVKDLESSLITTISGLPVVSEISDIKTGSYGHVNVVMPSANRIYEPDQVQLMLENGVPASEIA